MLINSKTTFVTVNRIQILCFPFSQQNSKTTFVTVNLPPRLNTQALYNIQKQPLLLLIKAYKAIKQMQARIQKQPLLLLIFILIVLMYLYLQFKNNLCYC